MLVIENAYFMDAVEDLTLQRIKDNLYSRFATRLRQEILETDHHKQGLMNYEYFKLEYSKPITYNNKNISYQETFYDLKQECGRYLGLVPEIRYTAGTNEITKEEKVYRAPTEEEFNARYLNNNNPAKGDYEKLKKLEDYIDFFGRGEFPYMTITIIRIGNQDYYFGKIHR